MTYLYLKAIHIIFIVTWFAGLFYMPRLLVYLIECDAKEEPARSILHQQLILMASRLWYGIAWPSAVITLVMGASLIISEPSWLKYPFMHIKLSLVLLLYGYHFSLHYVFRQLQVRTVRYTSQQMRMWNEVATLFLFSIVFLIVVKTALSIAWAVAGLLVLTGGILFGIRIYKKYRRHE